MKQPPTRSNESNSITIEIKSACDNGVITNNNSISKSSPDTTQTEGTLKMSDTMELLGPNDDEGKLMDGVDNPAFENDTQMSNGTTMSTLPSNGGDSRLLNYSNCERKLKYDLDYKSTEEMAEAVNLELMNTSCSNLCRAFNGTNRPNRFNRLNGTNVIPVKSRPNSTVINMAANPYGEFFIPVNDHRKYMRGEKLYVTKSKRDVENSKNICCVWLLVGLVTAMIAICLAILIATKSNQVPSTIANNERRFSGDNVMNAEVGGNFAPESSASFDNRAESTRSYLEHALEGEFTLDDIDITPGLADHESKEFKEVATSIETRLEKALFDKSTLVDADDANIHIRVINLTPEKVIQYRVGWTFKSGVHNPLDPISVDAMRDRLKSSINATNGFLYNYRVPLSKIYSKRMIDDCSLNNGNCSHICSFDYETQLDFYCHCPEGMKIDQTTYTCEILHDTESEGVNSEPEVSPEPTTNPEPQYSPASESDHWPEPTSESAPKYELETSPESASDSEPEPISVHGSVPEPEPESKPEIAPESKGKLQSNIQPEPKTEPKQVLEPELIALPEPTSEQLHSSSHPEPEFKTEVALTLSPEPKPEPESTTDRRTNSKPDPPLAPELELKSELKPISLNPESEPKSKHKPTSTSPKLEPKSEPEPFFSVSEFKSEPVPTSSAPEVKLEPEETSALEPKSEPGPTSTLEVKSEPEITSVPEPKLEPEPIAAAEVNSEPEPASVREPKSEPEPAAVQEVKSSPLGEQTTTPVPMPTGHSSASQAISTTLLSDELPQPRSSKTLDADAVTKSDERIDHERRSYSNTEVSDVMRQMGEDFTPAPREVEEGPKTEPVDITTAKVSEDPVNGFEVSSSSVSTSSNDIESVEGKVIPDEWAPLNGSIEDTSEIFSTLDTVRIFLRPALNVSVVRNNEKNKETDLNDVRNTKDAAKTRLKESTENTIDVSESSQQFNGLELIPSPDEDTTNNGTENIHLTKETSTGSIKEGLEEPESDIPPPSFDSGMTDIATKLNPPSQSNLNLSQYLSDSAATNSS